MGFIKPEDLERYCNTNAALLKGPLNGVVVEFPGLGGNSCLGGVMDFAVYDNTYTRRFAEKGILSVYTFPGPWSWGNAASVRIADMILDAVFEKYGVTDVPVFACGGSMGGLGALIFCADSKYSISACAAACPCYDVPECFEKRGDFSRTILSAVAGYAEATEEALKRISPAHRIADMPDIPYRIVCDGADEIFDADGMKRYAEELDAKTGGKVTFVYLEGLCHGGFSAEEREAFHVFIEENCAIER